MKKPHSEEKDPEFRSLVDGRIAVEAIHDWEEAVRFAGDMLVRDNFVRPAYVEGMIRFVWEEGPWSVLLPGVCLPHANRAFGVLKSGCSLLILKDQGIRFEENGDIVRTMIVVCSTDRRIHLDILRGISLQIADHARMALWQATADVEELRALL